MSILGVIFGFILAYASKKFAVKVDNRIIKIQEALPGFNCGACGYAGCSGYAEDLASGKIKDITLCKPGKQETIDKLKEVLK